MYIMKKYKLYTYYTEFAKLKTAMLHYKWLLDSNLDGNSIVVKRMAKVAKLLYDIEREFEKDKGGK